MTDSKWTRAVTDQNNDFIWVFGSIDGGGPKSIVAKYNLEFVEQWTVGFAEEAVKDAFTLTNDETYLV